VRVVILVPWRTDDGARAAVWKTCKSRWQGLFPDWPVYEGASPDGPFNRSAAINDAARQAGEWDVAVIIDADVMLRKGNVEEAVKRARKTGKVTWAHRRWRGITEEATKRLTRPDPVFATGALGNGGVEHGDFIDADIDLIIEKTTRMSWSCCMAVTRKAWDTIGGFDERFAGWGFEDIAFQAASGGLVGWDRVEGDVLNMWHPRVPGAGRADKDTQGYTAQALVNGRLGMRYMVALRRDHRLTDRPEPSGDVEIQRDIGNLMRQDEEFAKDQAPGDRRRWEGWWPTLEELRDGALDMTIGPPESETVTVVVTSGGPAERWDDRKPYLERSLASFVENVNGPIVQRVLYSDWPDEIRTGELSEIANRFGFYVVGAGHHGHTGMRQRLWRYLDKHAAGDYVFATEDDFLYERPVDLGKIVATLRRNPFVVQMALLRDNYYPVERQGEALGDILGWGRELFTFHDGWFSHRLLWTNNPSVFRKSITARPWPLSREDPRTGRGDGSEVVFWKYLAMDSRLRSAYWGSGENWISHIGEVRAGTGY
jgi:hypothetical protein